MIKIEFDKNSLNRIMAALNRIKAAAERLESELPEQAATGYIFQVLNNVQSEKYGLFGKDYAIRYEAWKLKKAGHLKPFVLYGDFLNSLGVHKISRNVYYGGVMPGNTDHKGKEVAMYMGANEKKRPLFTATRMEYITTWHPLLGKKWLDNIKQQWR